MTSEGAFSYLARDFGLKELYLWPINADQQGTPQQVRKVIDAVQGEPHPGGLLREHRVARSGRAGGARDRRQIWRRALCRLAQRGETGRCRPISTCCSVTAETIAKGLQRNERAARQRATACQPTATGIAVEHVTVTYRNGHTALRDATFAIPRGTITALVGVNGRGKSTLFKAIMGFVPLAAGKVTILGDAGGRGAEAEPRRLCAAERGCRLELSRCWSRTW